MGNAPTHGAAGGFRPDIGGVRGVAILLVIAYHAGVRWTTGGQIGVTCCSRGAREKLR